MPSPPWRLRDFFFAGLYVETSCLVCLGILCHTLSQHSTQPYSLWNDAIAGYNGACAKVVFTARRRALARSLLSAGVHPSVCPPRSCTGIQTAEDIIKHLSRPGSPIILFLTPSTDSQFQEIPFIGGAKYTGPFAISD